MRETDKNKQSYAVANQRVERHSVLKRIEQELDARALLEVSDAAVTAGLDELWLYRSRRAEAVAARYSGD